jgi:hypothetical protein
LSSLSFPFSLLGLNHSARDTFSAGKVKPLLVFNQQVGALQQFLNSPIPSGQPTLSPPRNTHLVSSRVSKLTCAKSPLAAAWALARIANFRLT